MLTKTVLVSYHPAFIPACKLLARQGFQFLCLNPEMAQILKDIDLPAKPLGEFSQGLHEPAFAEASKLIQAVPQSLRQNGLGQDMMGFIGQQLPAFLYPRLSDLALVTLTLDRVKPFLALVHNDVEPMMRVVALWAASRGIPCLHVPHAIYQDVNRGPAGTDVHDLITASHLASSGPFQSRWYQQRGMASTQINETGLPQYDVWANLQTDKAKAKKRFTKFDPRKPVITYASTWGQMTNALGASDGWAYTYVSFLKAVAPLDVNVIVKCHPRANEDSHRWHAQQAGEHGVECAFPTIHTPDINRVILEASDALLVYAGSNLLLEAAHVEGVRLLTTGGGYTDDPEVVKVEETTEAMRQALVDSLSRPAVDTSRLRQDYLGLDDGRASERVAGFIGELCK
jgi:hypothetical protein